MQSIEYEPHSYTQPSEINLKSKAYSVSIPAKHTNILKIQSQIRKLKHIVSMQNELRRNRQQFQKINNQITQFQEILKIKRKQAYKQKMAQIEHRRYQRDHQNKLTNQTLAQIKHGHQQRRKKMESLIHQYKQQYEQVYLSKLMKRKKLMQLDIESIKIHQSRYLQSQRWKQSSRIKTQNCEKIIEEDSKLPSTKRQQQINQSTNIHDAKVERTRQLIRKRKQYGQNAERAASGIKITKQMVRRAKSHKQTHNFDPSIVQHEYLKKKQEKPKLNTNFFGSLQHQQKRQINKIAHDASPVKQKLTKLGNLAEGLKVRYENGRESALDKMCNINLMRANILLNDT